MYLLVEPHKVTLLVYFLILTRFDVNETLCPQQMLVHKGGQRTVVGSAEKSIITYKIAVSNYSKSTSKSKSAMGDFSKKIK